MVRNIRLRRIRPFFTGLVILIICLQTGVYGYRPARTIPQDASAARVSHLLEVSGYKFKELKPTVWKIDFTGKSLASFEVRLATSDDLLVSFVIVAKRQEMQISSDLMKKLLKFNHDLDRVKVGFD